MGITRRKDSLYVEFRVLDNAKTLTLAPPGMGSLKRWKVGSLNRRCAKDQEALIKTRLMSGQEASPSAARAQAMTFRQWAKVYLELEQVRKLKGYSIRKLYVANLTLVQNGFSKNLQLGVAWCDQATITRRTRAVATHKPEVAYGSRRQLLFANLDLD